MISEHDRLLKIDECERLAADTFYIYRPTWQLITKALSWSMEKSKFEIKKRIEVCEMKAGSTRMKILRNNWLLVIETLKWVLEATDIDPLDSRKALIPFA